MEAPEDWSDVPTFGERSAHATWVPRPGAYSLIEAADGRIALVRTHEGLFLPGGGIEAGETAAEAACREALEECGLAIEPKDWRVCARRYAYSTPEDKHFEKRCTFIAAIQVGPAGTPLERGHELVWAEPAEATARISDDSHAWAVAQWQQRLRSA